MALKFVEKRTEFKGLDRAFDTPDSHSFDRTVKEAHVLLRGFKLFFEKSANPAQLLEVGVFLVQAAGNDVRYRVHTEFKDNKTGADKYSGHADVLLIVELADQPAPSSPPASPPA
jgi:hypothetical protein